MFFLEIKFTDKKVTWINGIELEFWKYKIMQQTKAMFGLVYVSMYVSISITANR